MKTTQILKALNLVSNQYTRNHCSKLADIFSLLKEIKKDITEVLLLESELVYIGKTTEIKYRNREIVKEIVSNGIEMKGQKIQVTFTKGVYTFTLPTDNEFYFAVCELLEITGAKKETVKETVLQSISVDANIIKAIGKAAKFVSKDNFRPAFTTICLHFKDGKVKVVATDAHRLFYSRDFLADNVGEMKVLIASNFAEISKIKVDKTDTLPLLTIDLTNENKAIIGGVKCELLSNIDYPNYEQVIPSYKDAMQFDKKSLIAGIKEVLPYSNKSTVIFHLNGAIQMMAQDVDFSFETEKTIKYISKDFIDTDIAFNGKFLIECLSTFKASELSMYHNGSPFEGAIFTDGIDNCLLMPLMLNR